MHFTTTTTENIGGKDLQEQSISGSLTKKYPLGGPALTVESEIQLTHFLLLFSIIQSTIFGIQTEVPEGDFKNHLKSY